MTGQNPWCENHSFATSQLFLQTSKINRMLSNDEYQQEITKQKESDENIHEVIIIAKDHFDVDEDNSDNDDDLFLWSQVNP